MWCFFFFKQKTAYEMRISDWSSDVCSSDLQYPRVGRGAAPPPEGIRPASGTGAACLRAPLVVRSLVRKDNPWENIGEGEQILAFGITGPVCPGAGPAGPLRSEEHTSELQSLMRISYAVFCLQKKTKP